IWSSMERVREARTLWRTAVDQVHETLQKSTTTEAAAGRAKAALQALDKLPWDGVVKGFKGGPVDSLALWFTTDWLKTDHEDEMLELLAADLGLSDGSTCTIEMSYLVCALAQAYSDLEEYRTVGRFRWLRRLGVAFATKDRDRLGSIANIYDNHWVALTIDCGKKVIGYGDGFRGKVPPSLHKHLDWWLFEHLGVEFKWTDIPIPKQTDPHSCGLLAYFALANWFNSERFPLPKCSAAFMADERIKMFLRVVERHERKAGDFASDARDYEFTFAHSLGLGDKSSIQERDEDDGENASTDQVEAEHSAPGSEYSVHDDDTDSTSDRDSDTPSSPPSPSPRATRSLPSRARSPRPTSASPTPDCGYLSEDEFPLNIGLSSSDSVRPTTPTAPKRTHSERASDAPHASPDKKRLKEKVKSATSQATI
ncbi:hypothetical protein B0H13DRAFT_1623428, partial [Mycena leptocephala]